MQNAIRRSMWKIAAMFCPRVLSIKSSRKVRLLRGWMISGKRNVAIGTGCVISRSVQFAEGVTLEDYVRLIGSPRIKLGANVYINCFCMMLGDIVIGDNAMISQFVNVWGRSHSFARRDLPIWVQHGRGGQGYKTGPIRIGEGAWVGPHVTVLRGVTIGQGAVIGANAVVTKDVPPFGVAMGVPARVRGFRGVTGRDGQILYDPQGSVTGE